MKNGLLDYLIDYLESFMMESDWTEGNMEEQNFNTAEQARAIFTTICLIGNIDADTSVCDNMLLHLYDRTIGENIMSYDEFEGFMVELIV